MSSTLGDLFGDAPPPEPKTTTYHNKNGAKTVREGEEYLMPFGKHAGSPLMKLPLDYVVWLWWKAEASDKPFTGKLRDEMIRVLESYNIDHKGEKPVVPRSDS